jgi:ATP-dependent DNA helicase RecG
MAIADPKKLLQRLLKEPHETEWLEFKHNKCHPDQIGKCVSAAANAAMLAGRDRAFMVFGIENKTKKKLGTEVRLMELTKGGENFQNWLTRMLEPRLMIECIDFEDGGKHFSVIAVEPTYDRPVRFSGSEYIRIGENITDLKSHPEYERSLWLATGKRKFDSAIALSHQLPGNVLKLLNTQSYYELTKEERPANDDEVLRRLAAIGCIRDDMEGGFDITNLGAILFANKLSEFPSIQSMTVSVIKYKGRDKRESSGEEQEGVRGYAVGFSGLIQYIMKELPRDERYIKSVRQIVPRYSETAIREIVANALIHQDFTLGGGGPVIELYSDRVEISNPGNALIEIDRIIDERRSRNEKLASTMRDLGLCEERGGGIDKAIIEIEEMGLPAPEFFVSENSMRVVLFEKKKFSQLSKSDKIWACFCHCVVRWLRHDYMSNSSLRERFSLEQEEYQAVSAVIADTRKANKIVPADQDQGKRNARYVPYWAR